MTTEEIIALAAAVLSAISLVVSWAAYQAGQTDSRRALERDRSVGEIELFGLWNGVRLVHPIEPSTPQVSISLRPLTATSRRWLDEPAQRKVIIKNFRGDYIAMYESFRDCKSLLPGIGKRPSAFLTKEMDITYQDLIVLQE